jgi:hypothetical protein
MTATPLTKATALNVTALLTSLGANTGVSFQNTGREFLVVSMGSSASVVTENIGTTIQGQAVAPVTSSPTVSAISTLGPWPSQFNQQDGTQDVFIDFSVSTGISVALLQTVGVS